jgi:hypothetical protein
LGIGDWGLGIGPNPQSPIPNPQSPIPNPQNFIIINIKINLTILENNFFMKKNTYDSMMQKYNKLNIFQKSLSLSKFNSNDSKITTNSKRDYFDLLTQIKKEKVKLGPPPTLFHYFIKKNAQRSINIRLSYLARREYKGSLFNEKPKTNPKNISFPKTSFNISFKDKNISVNKKRNETPKLPVNRVLKLDDVKKAKIKPLKAKKYIPMERRDSYKNFINKMNQNNYMKYSN